MNDIHQVLKILKDIPLERLSNEDLEVLKNEIIKLLVDIQIQKDINTKLQAHHSSTDDIQIKIMHKSITNDVTATSSPSLSSTPLSDEKISTITNQSNTITNLNTEKTSEPTSDEAKSAESSTEYKRIIEEEISEKVLSIYTTNEDTLKSELPEVVEMIAKENVSQKESSKEILNKITFTINDKFRIQRKLFKNNASLMEKFLNELHQQNTLQASEKFIHATAQNEGWDEDAFEYQLLLKQNQKRFK
ncbi:MAG: hypothetical protein N3F62_00910 [Bacteroidia bacterium]|nr:hypothetical protein [Bacteroidia bacterium]